MKSQRGATIVEFLAGLALIGVATAGALVGFEWVMNTTSARKIYSGLTARALAAQGSAMVAQAETGTTVSLGGFASQDGGISYTIRRESGAGDSVHFSIELSNISQGICQRLLAQNYSIVPFEGIKVNGYSQMDIESPSADDCGNSETVALTFYFDSARNDFIEGCVGDECHPEPEDDDHSCSSGEVWNPFDKVCVDVNSWSTACGSCQENYMCSVEQWAGSSGTSKLKSKPTCQAVNPIYVQGRSGRIYLSAPKTMSWWDAMNFCKAVNVSTEQVIGVSSDVADYEGAWTSTTVGSHNALYTMSESVGTENKTKNHYPLCPTNSCTNNNPCKKVQSNACEFSDMPNGMQCQMPSGENGYCYSGNCNPVCITDDDCPKPKVCGDLKICTCPAESNPCKIVTDEATCTAQNVEDGTACHSHGQCLSGVCQLDNCRYLDAQGITRKSDDGTNCTFKDLDFGGVITAGKCQDGICGPTPCSTNSNCSEPPKPTE